MYINKDEFNKLLIESGYSISKTESLERFEWFNFAVSYLEASKVLFIRASEILDENTNEDIRKRPTPLIPAYFNLNHSLELFIKTIQFKINGRFEFTHNIKKLGGTMKELILKVQQTKSEELVKWIDRLSEKFPGLYQKGDQQKISALVDLFFDLVIKYHNIEDAGNEEYRYPVTSSNRFISSLFATKAITKVRLDQIIEDITVLEILFHFINSFMDIGNDYLLGIYD